MILHRFPEEPPPPKFGGLKKLVNRVLTFLGFKK